MACLVRILFVPEARRDKISGKDFFYRLPSTLYPHSGFLWLVPFIGLRLNRKGA